MAELTQALADLRAGNSGTAAVNALFCATYDELKRLAHQRLQRDRPVDSLDTTSVVHESYLRFLGAERIELRDRAHFLSYASKVMRSVIVDLVRRGAAERRGGNLMQVTLAEGVREFLSRDEELLHLDEALERLALVEPQLVQIVELRFFAGLSVPEVAGLLGVSERSVFRQWDKARLVLLDALREA
ncbi:MAG: ECF-type sigma factor [Steroidobacteraceae bacterium]